jgi:hypothetical protein
MSRAHAVAPLVGAKALYGGPGATARTTGPRTVGCCKQPTTSCYLERAMLLWPRLNRAKLRKIADNPARIAELVERRTSQPYDVILAMLTRQSETLASPTEQSAGFDSGRSEAARVALRVVRLEEGTQIEVQDLVPA